MEMRGSGSPRARLISVLGEPYQVCERLAFAVSTSAQRWGFMEQLDGHRISAMCIAFLFLARRSTLVWKELMFLYHIRLCLMRSLSAFNRLINQSIVELLQLHDTSHLLCQLPGTPFFVLYD